MSSVVEEKLESLGDSITTAVLLSWNKEPGDSVAEDDVIAVVETDKVTMDIRAKQSGVFLGGLVDAQAEVEVGAPLYKMDTSTTDAPVNAEATLGNEAPPSPQAVAAASAAPPVMVPVPIMGESITTGNLASWEVKAGDTVNADDIVAVIETDKVNVDVRTPESGTIKETFAAEGDEVEVGNPLFTVAPGAGTTTAAASAPAPTPVAAAAPTPAATHTPAPAAAPRPAPSAKPAAASSSPAADASSAMAPGAGGDRSETRVKMTRMRQRIAQRLKEAQNTAAMLTTFQEVDMGPLIELRKTHKDEFEKLHGTKLGFMSAFVAASTATLQEIPAVNAVIDDATNEIVYRHYVDISVAVASPNGLVVPVLRNTENMSFAEVEKTIAFYGKKAREGNLALEDMAGGTFTISNGGVFGSLFGTPIINPPQSAILGMHATKMRPVVNKEGVIVARPMMYLALTYDHRMIDGREAVTFLKSVQGKIEDPARMLLSL
eukprot:CAMPEP_0174972816 /NCGR_PEP_ID=MMETSP0004_2-20121128/10859_1 /TAXON_ID=420556 /ORGANISM="Ochromonas sp., Strain CCMP1393" /LENGTH=489 /DNA_ID=CAMNT_0016223121 /DNA_START=296 /DNA_END=1765 /DNA_ORIENTATION=+